MRRVLERITENHFLLFLFINYGIIRGSNINAYLHFSYPLHSPYAPETFSLYHYNIWMIYANFLATIENPLKSCITLCRFSSHMATNLMESYCCPMALFQGKVQTQVIQLSCQCHLQNLTSAIKRS